MYWICYGECAGDSLREAHTLESGLSKEHIIVFEDDLSCGEIVKAGERAQREQTFLRQCAKPEDRMRCQTQIARHFETALPALQHVDVAAIWYADNPVEQCMLLYIIKVLHERKVPIWLIHVDAKPLDNPSSTRRKRLARTIAFIKRYGSRLHGPERFRRWRVKRKQNAALRKQERIGMQYFHNTGELCPEDAAYFYEKRRLLSPLDCQRLSKDWEVLCKENAPLRVLEAGKLCSANADYYDGLILSNMPTSSVPANTVVGRVISRHKLGICDWFVYERMRALIAQGRITIVSQAQGKMIIRRGG